MLNNLPQIPDRIKTKIEEVTGDLIGNKKAEIDPIFQGVNWLFVLFFENEENRKVHKGYYLPRVDIKE